MTFTNTISSRRLLASSLMAIMISAITVSSCNSAGNSADGDCNTVGWPIGGNNPDDRDPGTCFQFAKNITSESRKIYLLKSVSVTVFIDGCLDKSYIGGPLRPRSQVKRDAFIRFGFYSKSRNVAQYKTQYITGKALYITGEPGSRDCEECVIESPTSISADLAGGTIDLGRKFSVYIYSKEPIAEMIDRGELNVFDAVVTMESESSPIRKVLMDEEKCSANTSTDPTDWVELTADGRVVPIFDIAATSAAGGTGVAGGE